ncbi:hypothetical protein OPQ81_008392 [Rhizoctonia solani]|nr:hypothetical protein OPQ81_008392 [Rhizoctonia solani]
MRAFTVVSALIAVAVSGVVATPGDAVATLFARQDTAMPEIPPECQKSCATSQKDYCLWHRPCLHVYQRDGSRYRRLWQLRDQLPQKRSQYQHL